MMVGSSTPAKHESASPENGSICPAGSAGGTFSGSDSPSQSNQLAPHITELFSRNETKRAFEHTGKVYGLRIFALVFGGFASYLSFYPQAVMSANKTAATWDNWPIIISSTTGLTLFSMRNASHLYLIFARYLRDLHIAKKDKVLLRTLLGESWRLKARRVVDCFGLSLIGLSVASALSGTNDALEPPYRQILVESGYWPITVFGNATDIIAKFTTATSAIHSNLRFGLESMITHGIANHWRNIRIAFTPRQANPTLPLTPNNIREIFIQLHSILDCMPESERLIQLSQFFDKLEQCHDDSARIRCLLKQLLAFNHQGHLYLPSCRERGIAIAIKIIFTLISGPGAITNFLSGLDARTKFAILNWALAVGSGLTNLAINLNTGVHIPSLLYRAFIRPFRETPISKTRAISQYIAKLLLFAITAGAVCFLGLGTFGLTLEFLAKLQWPAALANILAVSASTASMVNATTGIYGLTTSFCEFIRRQVMSSTLAGRADGTYQTVENTYQSKINDLSTFRQTDGVAWLTARFSDELHAFQQFLSSLSAEELEALNAQIDDNPTSATSSSKVLVEKVPYQSQQEESTPLAQSATGSFLTRVQSTLFYVARGTRTAVHTVVDPLTAPKQPADSFV